MSIQNLIIRKADLSDLKQLVTIRIEVLRAANQLSNDVDLLAVEQESYHFYQSWLGTEEHVSYLAYDGNQFVGCGSVCFYRLMPTYHNSSGYNAYIMNMFTRPEYRRKGVAFTVLDLLIQAARNRQITKISLEATSVGRQLYEKYGFITMDNEMTLPINKLIKTLPENFLSLKVSPLLLLLPFE